MRRSSRGPDPDEPTLFDLPLGAPARDEPAAAEERPAPQRAAKPKAPKPPPTPARPAPVALAPAPVDQPDAPPLGRRLMGGAADLLVHAAAVIAALAGASAMGVEPALRDLPALAFFLLAFSFLYTVLPLAFWGQTLGMAWAGLVARSDDGEPLAFEQTALRWAGGLATVATLGLGLLGGRSLADRLSGSVTHAVH